MIKVGKVKQELLPAIWDDAVALLVECESTWLRTVAVSDVATMLDAGHMDLWGATEKDELVGVMFASWTRHRYEAEYHVNWIAGRKMKEWLKPGLQKVEHYVMLHNGTAVVIGGRVGWQRLLEKEGYAPVYQGKKIVHSIHGVN